MSNTFSFPIHTALDASGDPINGAKLNFYETGTSTPQDTFSDSALSSANANPVVADSAGRFGAIFLKDALYKVVLTDADDVELWTFDPVAPQTRLVGDTTPQLGGTLDCNSNAVNEAQGSDIASATTTDIGAAAGNYVEVTGTVTITGLGTVAAGTRRVVRFTGALTLTFNATSLILPTNASITTVAGDTATFISLGSGNWVCTAYQRDDGQGTLGGADQAQMEAATAANVYVTPNRQHQHPGHPKGWVKGTVAAVATVSYNVASITDNAEANFSVIWDTDFSSADYAISATVLSNGATALRLAVPFSQSAGATQVLLGHNDSAGTGVLVVSETNITDFYVIAFGDQ